MDKPAILAMDIATRTGWCYGRLDSGQPDYGSFRVAAEGAKSDDAFAGAFRWVANFMGEHEVNRFVIEATLDPRHLGDKTTRETGIRLIGLAASCRAAARLCGCHTFVEHRADKVRFSILGKRVKKADGKEPILWAVKARGFDCGDDDDAADAVAVWLYDCAQIRSGF